MHANYSVTEVAKGSRYESLKEALLKYFALEKDKGEMEAIFLARRRKKNFLTKCTVKC